MTWNVGDTLGAVGTCLTGRRSKIHQPHVGEAVSGAPVEVGGHGVRPDWDCSKNMHVCVATFNRMTLEQRLWSVTPAAQVSHLA